MVRQLKHAAICKWPNDYASLFNEIQDGFTIRKLVSKIESLTRAKKKLDDDEKMIYKGDLLEVLSEIFFILFPNDPALGIKEYEPVNKTDDRGVDAVGTNVNGEKVVIQVKYRNNPQDLIKWSDLARTYASGVLKYGIDGSKDCTIFLFTTAQDANYIAKDELNKKLVVVNKSIIARYIDNNASFWKEAFLLIKEHIEFYSKKPIETFLEKR